MFVLKSYNFVVHTLVIWWWNTSPKHGWDLSHGHQGEGIRRWHAGTVRSCLYPDLYTHSMQDLNRLTYLGKCWTLTR